MRTCLKKSLSNLPALIAMRGFIHQKPLTEMAQVLCWATACAARLIPDCRDYAEAFANAGFHALVFDYRGFGLSDGTPRQFVSVPRQRQDWLRAIATLPRSCRC
jgi:predicted alpha/beta hydrolase